METQIQKIRAFNRFYTRVIGLLDERLLDSPVSLVEGRVLLEVGRFPGCQATQLMRDLSMDRGQLSRVLGRLEEGGWLERRIDDQDRRVRPLHLTGQGRELLEILENRSSRLVAKLLAPLSPAERLELIRCMDRIEVLLNQSDILRP